MEYMFSNFYRILKVKLFIFMGFTCTVLTAQDSIHLVDGLKKDKIKFKLVNNLIVIPVELNGTELTFLLDTGVNSTIIFSLEKRDSVEFRNASKILIRGLGAGEPIEGLKSVDNELKIGKTINKNQNVYLVFDESMNLSPRMGFPIHGIIGYDFFKNLIVEINYDSQFLKVFDPNTYKYKKCRKCFETELYLRNNKPYIKTQFESDKGKKEITLLMDSGSGAALWLFEDVDEGIVIPEKSFEDYLGRGLNGNIYGKRAKIDKFELGDFTFEEVTTSFPDSIYTKGAAIAERQGTLGSRILRRFNSIVDYPNKKLSLKKNRQFKDPFNYNMSGLTIIHSGFRLVEELIKIKGEVAKTSEFILASNNEGSSVNHIVRDSYQLLHILKPKFEISEIRPESPAALVGLKKGDILTKINGRLAHKYSLSELNALFFSDEGKRIRMEIERNTIKTKYTFYLKKVL